MRYPAVAGAFYPKREDDLREAVEESFTSKFGPGSLPVLEKGPRAIKAGIVPHAGYNYSGPVAAHTFAAMAKDGFPETIVIIGPNHHAIGPLIALTDQDFMTPLGRTETDKELLNRLGNKIPKSRDAHALEHCIEVQLPFIQYIAPETKILPILMIDQTYDAAASLAKTLADACRGKDVLFLATTDMSHYVPPAVARDQDRKVIEEIKALSAQGVYKTVVSNKISMCGYGPVMTAMLASGAESAGLLKYGTSGDACDMKEVVGYASMIFA